MINPEEFSNNGKKRREALERKKVLLGLANEIKFESIMFPKPFDFSGREDLRYYLWMRELELWLGDKYEDECYFYNTTMIISGLEFLLIDRIKQVLSK